MTIGRPTRSYLYGTMCCKCRETLDKMIVDLNYEESQSASSSVLAEAQRLRQECLNHLNATQLAFDAIRTGFGQLKGNADD